MIQFLQEFIIELKVHYGFLCMFLCSHNLLKKPSYNLEIEKKQNINLLRLCDFFRYLTNYFKKSFKGSLW